MPTMKALMKAMSFRDLKAELNKMTDMQLDCPVVWWGEDRGGFISRVEILTEDHGNPSGDCVEPLSSYRDDYDSDEEYKQFVEDEKDYNAGDPVLLSNERRDS